MATTTGLMTFPEFEQLPDSPDELELVRGELIRLPRPVRKHMEAAERLRDRLKEAVENRRRADANLGLGSVHMEMGYLLSDEPQSWLRPDVSITHPNQPGEKYCEGAPLFAFEIVSEYDRARDLEHKVAEYLANGAAEVWLIYPDVRYARVHRAGETAALREDKAIHSPLLPGIEIPFDAFL